MCYNYDQLVIVIIIISLIRHMILSYLQNTCKQLNVFTEITLCANKNVCFPSFQSIDAIFLYNFFLTFQLNEIRTKLNPVDENVRQLRGTIAIFERIGIRLDYFSNILDQIVNGKNQFTSLLAEFETKFENMKEKAKVRKVILKT